MISFIKHHKLSLLTVIGIIIAAGTYLNFGAKPKTAKITIQKVKRGSIIETIRASGKIDAETKATLKFQTSGKLAWIGVSEGDTVKRGQAIASLDKRELEKN